MVQPLYKQKALDAYAVSSEIFINTAKDVLKLVTSGELGEVPLMFGHTVETSRPAGVIYVIPSSKRRSAFPVLWDTEPHKYSWPELFQALSGPEWVQAMKAQIDPNGTIHLEDTLLSDEGQDISSLTDLIDTYLKERLTEKGTLLLYRPLFSSVDRFRVCYITDDKDVATTKFLRELYGFYPSTDIPSSGLLTGNQGRDLYSDTISPQLHAASTHVAYDLSDGTYVCDLCEAPCKGPNASYDLCDACAQEMREEAALVDNQSWQDERSSFGEDEAYNQPYDLHDASTWLPSLETKEASRMSTKLAKVMRTSHE